MSELHADKATTKKINEAIYTLYDYYKEYDDSFDEMTQVGQKMLIDAINMQMQVVGETAKKLSDEFMELYGDYFDLHNLVRTRNLISHNYDAVNMRVIRKIIEESLPDMEYAIHSFDEYYARRFGDE